VIETLKNLSKEELIGQVVNHKSEIENKAKRIVELEAHIAWFNKQVFGKKSEKLKEAVHPSQVVMDLDLPTDVKKAEQKTKKVSYLRKAGNDKKRMEFPAHLETKITVIEPNEDITGCKALQPEDTKELEIIPAKFYLHIIRRNKYVTPDGRIIIAPMPHRPIHKGIPGPELLTTVIADKFMYHMPIYRQLKKYHNMGVDLSESTVCDWINDGCQALEPLYEIVKKDVLSSDYIQADETRAPVLDKTKKGKVHSGFFWVYHAPIEKKIFFDYRPGRGRDGPGDILKDFLGFLQTDANPTYDAFGKRKGMTHVGCMVHTRRNFFDIKDDEPENCGFVLQKMAELYAIEQHAHENNFTPEQRLAIRQEKAVGILEELKVWMLFKKYNDSKMNYPSNPFITAMDYALSRWDKLCEYTKDGRLEIDNNLVENAIRPVALGRKNYLFFGSHKAAQRAAMIYSFFAMCHYHKINPHEWLKDALVKVADPQYKNQLHTLIPGYTPSEVVHL
jgi:transposase